MILGLIVEGHGEVQAAPVLVRRLIGEIASHVNVEVRSWRVKRHRIVKPGELERVVQVLGTTIGEAGSMLVMLDADEDCPATLAPALLARAQKVRPGDRTSVVLAKREFESWFLASALSLRGHRTLRQDAVPPESPEEVIDAKGWLGARMEAGYSPTVDQAAFAACMDLEAARQADSFDKLVRELSRLVGLTQ